MENLTNDTPPKKGIWTPPRTVRFPPPSGASALFFLYKNPRQSRPEALLEGSKNFRESAFSGTFSSPHTFCTPPYHGPKLKEIGDVQSAIFCIGLHRRPWGCCVEKGEPPKKGGTLGFREAGLFWVPRGSGIKFLAKNAAGLLAALLHLLSCSVCLSFSAFKCSIDWSASQKVLVYVEQDFQGGQSAEPKCSERLHLQMKTHTHRSYESSLPDLKPKSKAREP